nr:hypothetical protein [Brachyspira hampsonii]
MLTAIGTIIPPPIPIENALILNLGNIPIFKLCVYVDILKPSGYLPTRVLAMSSSLATGDLSPSVTFAWSKLYSTKLESKLYTISHKRLIPKLFSTCHIYPT